MLDLLSKKESEVGMFNSWLSIIIKVLMSLSSKGGLNESYTRYMRQNILKIDQQHLLNLNPYLVELSS